MLFNKKDKMDILSTLAILFTLIGGTYGFWKKVISPRLLKNRLRRFYVLVEDWFDEIDRSAITDVSMTVLNNKQNKIQDFIKDHRLKNIKMNFSEDLRKRFLEFCGLKDEFQRDKELFEKYSRYSVDGISIVSFWDSLVGAFYAFKDGYEHADLKANYANIEMRVKLLKMYTGCKTT